MQRLSMHSSLGRAGSNASVIELVLPICVLTSPSPLWEQPRTYSYINSNDWIKMNVGRKQIPSRKTLRLSVRYEYLCLKKTKTCQPVSRGRTTESRWHLCCQKVQTWEKLWWWWQFNTVWGCRWPMILREGSSPYIPLSQIRPHIQ